MQLNLSLLKKQRPHFPVLIREILEHTIYDANFTPKIVLDCTFGAGGYSELILENSKCSVIGIDRDDIAKNFADKLKEKYDNRLLFFKDKFSNLDTVLLQSNNHKVDAIIMDLGFSTMQIKQPERGFAIKENGHLSMTMGINNFSAYDFINGAKQETIADVIYYYGEERKANQIAKKIVEKRKIKKIETTTELANIIREIYGGFSHQRIDVATKTFQAIRIHVNDELNELKTSLNKAIKHLNNHGKIIVVSFHSLEDRIVKDFFNNHSIKNKTANNFLENNSSPNINNHGAIIEILNKKPILPKEDEVKINPPSASAKLRIARLLEDK